jgi:hypothetical protein
MKEELTKLLMESYDQGVKDGLETSLQLVKERLAQPEQEPVAWADHGVVNWIADKQFKHASLLYTHPPQRTEPLIGCVNHDCAKCKEKNT